MTTLWHMHNTIFAHAYLTTGEYSFVFTWPTESFWHARFKQHEVPYCYRYSFMVIVG